ncbi:hypothetical protein CTAYLR_008486 [Chrysophaeum taylorii]|uniref:HMG box domain-containing protein n=1 Tax=Chrysophaeum taylorii TaxID=2483200 RepID=A0AAD7XH19_9STRA|nr:hypothetical protein CTAYLR_008486 [Chrysophaeum taylorii]
MNLVALRRFARPLAAGMRGFSTTTVGMPETEAGEPVAGAESTLTKPPKPPTRKTAYNVFMADVLKTITLDKDELAEGSKQQVRMRKAAKQWKGMSDADKSKYVLEAQKANAQYVKDKAEYVRLYGEPVRKKKGIEKVKKLNGYNLFFQSTSQDFPDLNFTEKVAAISSLWKQLDENEKKTWNEKAKTSRVG